jgi:hypothetical protein
MTKIKDSIIEWTLTALLITGVALTSFNIYPMNLWVCLAGNIGWIYLAWCWRKWSLFVVQLIITIIYILGISKVYL